MKRKYYSWDEAMSLREVKVFSHYSNHTKIIYLNMYKVSRIIIITYVNCIYCIFSVFEKIKSCKFN